MFQPIEDETHDTIHHNDASKYTSQQSKLTNNQEKRDEGLNNYKRPSASYAELITMAIESSANQMLPLKDIYTWISKNFPFFNTKKSGWQNSIRHNLSLNRCFYKVPRAEGVRGKGSLWKINYEFQNSRFSARNKRHVPFTLRNMISPQRNITEFDMNNILSDHGIVTDNIDVNEIPYKRNIFDGRLRSDIEYNTNNSQIIDDQAFDEDNERLKLDRIFSFK